tara:strand:+ start:475 stop:648 length:174 start_codon:yes stop_codon:yes gene_type:complete
MKAGDLFIDVGSEKPVVLLGEDVQRINYGTVVAHMVKILDSAGKIRTLEVKMLRSIK